MTKILVGTLFSGENEFDECLASIRKQSFTNYDHLIIENKPELEAHRQLFQTFLENKDRYDLLVKVDADMVLCSEDLFEEIARQFAGNSRLRLLSIRVYDFFTDSLINGLQTYRNTITWDLKRDTVFPDIPNTDQNEAVVDTKRLEPAAWHCPNPSVVQAFHYGVHRGIKSLQKIHSTTHWATLQAVWKHFVTSGDERLGMAVLGAELVYAGRFKRADQNYTNPAMEEALTEFRGLDAAQIRHEILKLRARHWGFLPSDLRRKILRKLRGEREGLWDQ